MFHSIGIDVHQSTLVVASSTGGTWMFPRDDTGLADLSRLLITHPCTIVAMEPSGGFERRVLRACWDHDIPVTLVNTWRVRAWITGEGVRVKTDVIDARMLSRFAAEKHLTPMKQPERTRLQLQELVRARRRLTEQAVGIEQQLIVAEALTRSAFEDVLAVIRTKIAEFESQIDVLVSTSPQLQEDHKIIQSVPGLGETTSAMLLAEVPELGVWSNKQVSALLGVAPITRQSGKSLDNGHIWGGRTRVRSALWMPTIVARRWNPVIRAFAERLKAEGKPGKVVTIACMHKLITIINAMLRNRTTWDPETAMA